MSFFGYRRRGLRVIVSREEIPVRRLRLTLECGHVVERGNHGVERASKQAVCPTCKRTDGSKRDADKASRDEAAE